MCRYMYVCVYTHAYGCICLFSYSLVYLFVAVGPPWVLEVTNCIDHALTLMPGLGNPVILGTRNINALGLQIVTRTTAMAAKRTNEEHDENKTKKNKKKKKKKRRKRRMSRRRKKRRRRRRNTSQELQDKATADGSADDPLSTTKHGYPPPHEHGSS